FVLLHAGEVQTQGTFAEIKANYPDAGESLNDIYLSLTGVTRDE
ncbi:multidrug ABC transporter ATP-binding protein, partial [Lactiplantibacillus plantarum]|nr:multidrug ABC transporter ATP-binding protein [Lactiplantibacillus plantarum]